MDFREEISQCFKKQNVLILEKSAVQNDKQGAGPQTDALMLHKKHQIFRRHLICLRENPFGRKSPYLEFCVKSNDSSNDTHLENDRHSVSSCKEIYNPSKGEERRQSNPSRIFKSLSELLEENLQDGIENKAINTCKEEDLVQNGTQESVQLMKSTEEKIVPKKRKHEDGEDASSPSEENVAKKMIVLKTEKEIVIENPYLEYILKSEDSNSSLCVTENSEEFHLNSVTSEGESKMNKKRYKNRADIFGNHFTAKDRNKMKVNCPHCTKIVPAPGFVRHLGYCMGVNVRKSARRT